MSSIYRILCLSHDPAIPISTADFNRPEHAEAQVRSGVEGHETCDLMIGRYSYPLIEVGCPDSTARNGRRVPETPCFHGGTEWIGVEWLRLLAAALAGPKDSPAGQAASASVFRCWTSRRVGRLWRELGVEEPQP